MEIFALAPNYKNMNHARADEEVCCKMFAKFASTLFFVDFISLEDVVTGCMHFSISKAFEKFDITNYLLGVIARFNYKNYKLFDNFGRFMVFTISL